MKKIFNFGSVALSVIFALGFSACNEEVDYIPAGKVDDNCIKASFTTDNISTEVSPTGEKTLTLTVVRENTVNEATIALNVLRNDGNVFQIPESVTFAPGQESVTFDMTFPNVEIGVEYTYSIGLEETVVDPYSQNTLATTTGTVQMIQWDLLGTGTLSCTLLNSTATCNVYKASHAAWYKAEAPVEEGMDILFIVNDDNSVTVSDQPIFTDTNYGTVYVNNTTGGGIYDAEANIIQATFYYYCSAGYFGTFVETLTLPAE